MTTAYVHDREGRPPVTPGSGGRHYRYPEPSLVALAAGRLLTLTRGVCR